QRRRTGGGARGGAAHRPRGHRHRARRRRGALRLHRAVPEARLMPLVEAVISGPMYAHMADMADDAYPDEGCGSLVGHLSGGRADTLAVTRARNLNAERSRDRYVLDPADIVEADREARARGWDIVGFWHSHPDHPAQPSQFDTDHAWVDYVYVICATT